MVFGFYDNSSGAVCLALVPITPEGVNMLGVSRIIRTAKEVEIPRMKAMSSAILLTFSNCRGSFTGTEK